MKEIKLALFIFLSCSSLNICTSTPLERRLADTNRTKSMTQPRLVDRKSDVIISMIYGLLNETKYQINQPNNITSDTGSDFKISSLVKDNSKPSYFNYKVPITTSAPSTKPYQSTVRFDEYNDNQLLLLSTTTLGPLTPEEIKRQKYRSTVRPEAGVNPFVDLLNIDKFKDVTAKSEVSTEYEYITPEISTTTTTTTTTTSTTRKTVTSPSTRESDEDNFINNTSNETPAESSEALNLESDEDKIINNDNHNHNSGGENDLKLNDENSDNNNNKDNVKDANENKDKIKIEEIECDTVPNLGLLRNGLGSTGFLWPGGKIPYMIKDGFDEEERTIIQDSINYYNSEFDECIKWQERKDEVVYVTFEKTGGCSSKVGVAYFPFPVAQSILLGKCATSIGHVKHEMMHTLGFYHEHSRSDRDEFIKIMWDNISPEYHAQFDTYRWTTGYGEEYDYKSIMHYSSRAFVKNRDDKELRTIIPKSSSVAVDDIGFKNDLSDTDKTKIRKMYKCSPFRDYKASCSSDEQCGINEYCAPLVSECRTRLPEGSFCLADQECLKHCSGGVCSSCVEDSECNENEYCAYKYVPVIENKCSSFCGGFCLFDGQCKGECSRCSWGLFCSKP